ncbi:hypothetical protein MKJ01_17575 [Chryseobacterium sp. SSA4.19]|uniref:hypothetical protein n=1 Tax=Chryseobacterium sp. SSA4.19 TaxID=2919915 RepID=UPI001F4E2CC4|nr:hypothetical protein [Chryseobacterium sp. SSA4.19]MCJ8155570.1 hypothetical protein [Chryseobacterium sp. SSA4.19]
MAQFQLGISLTFLKRDLALVAQSTEKVATDGKKITIKEYLLVPTKVSSEDYVTYKDLKEDFTKIFGSDSGDATQKIENQLKQNSSDTTFDINKIHFYLKTAYLYKKTYYTEKTDTDPAKSTIVECDETGKPLADGKKSKWDYALSISIDSKEFFSEFSTMSINSVNFSIWNTDRNVVKKMMTLGSTDDIFKQLEESSK